MLLSEFYTSLRQDQASVIMQTLDMQQKIMFMEIVNLVKPPDQDVKSTPHPSGGVNAPAS